MTTVQQSVDPIVGPRVRTQAERVRRCFDEKAIIRGFFRSLELSSRQQVVDVGCGYGQKLAWLKDEGLTAVGVDINSDLVSAACDLGLKAMTVDEWRQSAVQYDAMLMAHIVEHFGPADLLSFVDSYLDRLKVGGHLVVSTPLDWRDFYADFDHAKPYHPNAFLMVFCQPSSQVQYHSRNRLELVDFGLRRIPKRQPGFERLYSSYHDPGLLWRVSHDGLDFVRRRIFRLTRGALGGHTNGWIGLFQKVGSNRADERDS